VSDLNAPEVAEREGQKQRHDTDARSRRVRRTIRKREKSARILPPQEGRGTIGRKRAGGGLRKGGAALMKCGLHREPEREGEREKEEQRAAGKRQKQEKK